MMLESPPKREADRAAAWDRLVRERVGGPLRPEGLRSVFLIVPFSSGDVALATTVIRWVKERNPRCHVTFATKHSNLPLLGMCPGVDEAVEIPFRPLSRRRDLAEFAGRADAVIYPVCSFEDWDLLGRYNFLETIWLLSGVPGGVPPGPQRPWLTPGDAREAAGRALARCLGRGAAARLTALALRRGGGLVCRGARERRVGGLGWRTPARMLRNASLVRGLARQGSATADIQGAAKRFVIVSSEAVALPPPAAGLFEEVIRLLRARGRVVLQNVLDPAAAAPGAVPLVCSYEEFAGLRQSGVPFVGWRSGLCDIAAASHAPMAVLYPSSMAGCATEMQAHVETPLKSFGFASMGVAADCLEMVCDGVQDLDAARLAAFLGRDQPMRTAREHDA